MTGSGSGTLTTMSTAAIGNSVGSAETSVAKEAQKATRWYHERVYKAIRYIIPPFPAFPQFAPAKTIP